MRLVPARRLLFWFGLVVAPFSLIAMTGEAGLLLAGIAIGGLLMAALVDALRGTKRLDGLAVELPEVVRLAKDRPGRIEVRIQNKNQNARRLRIGFSLPEEVGATRSIETVVLPAGTEWSALSWTCQPRERGNFPVTRAYLETASPLGFWAVRGSAPVRADIRVYPNLLSERRQLAAMFLHRGRFGSHAQRQVGKGRDFEKLREYIHGDGLDEIHWKATAKRGHPVTKVFQIERTQEVYVAIDASRLSARIAARPAVPAGNGRQDAEPAAAGRTAQRDSALERYVTAALVLGLAAEQQGDLFGLVTFSDRVNGFVRAKSGRAHFNSCRDALYALKPQTVTPDFEEVASFIRLRLRRRALLLFLTALDDPVLAENFVKSMELLCRQHLVMVGMIRPAGAAPLFSSDDVENIDDIYERLGGHMRWSRLREFEKILGRRGVRLQLLDQEELSAQLVSAYMAVKQRQLL
ncbi:MAG: DUF58 domain-containing protein [Verrucomicrobia subdivision 3 bacterium]|nr:DUF58 domain-containing protein [Limisphaerales bacterium]